MNRLILCTLGFLGCGGPYIAELVDPSSEDSDANVPGEDGPEDTPVELVSGTWELTGYETVDDPCAWNAAVYEWTRLEIGAFLPSTFTVTGRADAFEIKAVDYETSIEVLPPPLTREMSAIFKRIRYTLSCLAEKKKIPAEFLCNKKELEQILRTHAEGKCYWPERLNSGWRSLWVKPAIESELVTAKLA